jgi:anti-anti-sigma regulatory factor
MAIALWLNVGGTGIVPALQDAVEKLDGVAGEVVLDFMSVNRIDSSALRAMEGLAAIADQKAVKIVLRDVNVDVYKVLKLVKLARRFSFANSNHDRAITKLESRHAEASAK